jgi:hypothetical protein
VSVGSVAGAALTHRNDAMSTAKAAAIRSRTVKVALRSPRSGRPIKSRLTPTVAQGHAA